MTPYVRKGRRFFEMRVPLVRGTGDGPIRTLGTDNPEEAEDIRILLTRLRKKTEYWPLIEAVTHDPPRLSLMDLYLADKSNSLDALLERLDDADLVEYLDGWERWVNSNLGGTGTAAMYRMQVETLIAPKGEKSPAFLSSSLTMAAVNKWLAEKPASSGYKRKLLYALFSFIRYLIEEGVFETNPIEKITRPKKGKNRVRWETEANDVRIVKASSIEYQGLFALIKSTGAEVTPATLLVPHDVTLWKKNTGRYCGVAHIEGTKNETRNRHDVLIEKWARPFIAAALKGKLPNARVWDGVTRYMAHWHHQSAAEAVQVLDYTLRDSRHSWAVRGRKARPQVSFEAIAEQLGNTVAVVADVYAQFKMTPDERKREGSKSTRTATRKRNSSKPHLAIVRQSATR